MAEEQFEKTAIEKTDEIIETKRDGKPSYSSLFSSHYLLEPSFLLISFIPGIFMYILLFLLSNPYIKFIVERLVTEHFRYCWCCCSSIYNSYTYHHLILLQILLVYLQQKNKLLHLIICMDWIYLTLQQLWNAVKGIVTFDLGASFAGNEDVAASIANKFPITFTIAMYSRVDGNYNCHSSRHHFRNKA